MVLLLCLLAFAGSTQLNAQTSGCYKAISGDYYHSLAIQTDGTLWAWGYNGYGELGDGTNVDKNSPMQIGIATNWTSISAGGAHSLAIKTDGSLWAWGLNGLGQLGDGTTTNTNSPVQIGTATNWASISAGFYYTLAIKTDGSLWAWGKNFNGQLGDGTNTDKYSPVQIGTATNWASISAGETHSLAIKTDGSLWAWGENLFGQLGDGTNGYYTSKNSPVHIGSATSWASISAGGFHSLAIKTDGSLWAWGFNYHGELGDGTTTDTNSPVQIGTETNWASINAAETHSFAIKNDGSLWAWGNNFSGELGDGTYIETHSPVQIGTETNWASISSVIHSLAIKTDRSLWAWGYNVYGQLGDGTNTDTNSPLQISSCPCPTASTLSVSACGSYTWVEKDNKVYTASNTTDTIMLTNAAGCDSVVTLNLTVKAKTTSDTTATACDSYTWHSSTYTSSGDYVWHTTNAAGCDSARTLHLTIHASTTSDTTATACDRFGWHSSTHTSSGDYVWHTTNEAGCDSTRTLHLTIKTSTTSDTTATICKSFTWHDSTYKASGNYVWRTTNAAGCDSTRTLHLTFLSVSSTTAKTDALCANTANGTLTVTPTNGVSPYTYKIGTTSSFGNANTFTGLRAGKYRVSILDANGCAGITSQVTITQPVAVTGTASSTPATCFGGASGSITVTPSTGVVPFMYKLGTTGTFGSSNVFNNVKGGNYIVYLQDANTCVGYTTVTVLQPTKLSATYTKTDETCPNAKNGSVTITPSGATPPYSYRFGTTGNFVSSNTFSNLKAGNYRIYVRDANNCSGYSILTTVGQTSPTCIISTRNMAAKTDIAATQQSLAVQLTPNPSNSFFTLRVKATEQSAVQIRVIDVNGKSLFTAKGMTEQAFRFGESFAPGVYMIEVRQGDEVKTVKGVKMK